MDYKILLITTEGCKGCNVAKNSIRGAIQNTMKKFKVEVSDYHDLNKNFLYHNRVTDFPTTLFMAVSDSGSYVVLKKVVGSYPVVFVNRWIDLYFRN